jgi:hypothetical protein
MGFSVIRTIKNVLFGSGSNQKNAHQQRTTHKKATSKKKIFTKEEGEYVDYEEVKE